MKFNINFRLFVWTYGVVILSSIINVILWNIYLFLYTKYFIFDIALYYKNICNYFSWFPGKLICYINFFSISITAVPYIFEIVIFVLLFELALIVFLNYPFPVFPFR